MNEYLDEDFDVDLDRLLPVDELDDPDFDDADVDEELQALAATVQAARLSGA